jgi:hypothetical protein
MARSRHAAAAAAAAAPAQPTAGFLLMASAQIFSTTWRSLEEPDPALMPPAVAAYGWPAASAAYAGWPRQAAASAKAAYFLRHLPQLMAHVHVFHW